MRTRSTIPVAEPIRLSRGTDRRWTQRCINELRERIVEASSMESLAETLDRTTADLERMMHRLGLRLPPHASRTAT